MKLFVVLYNCFDYSSFQENKRETSNIPAITTTSLIRTSVHIESTTTCQQERRTDVSCLFHKTNQLFIMRTKDHPTIGDINYRIKVIKIYFIAIVKKCCYLADNIGAKYESVASINARVRNGWSNFREFMSLLTSRMLPLSTN